MQLSSYRERSRPKGRADRRSQGHCPFTLTRIRFFLVLLLIWESSTGSLSGCSRASVEQNQPQKTPEKSEGERIIFAGLAGASPAFIDSGPERGQGWQEVETQAVRRGLAGTGFRLDYEWMSSARIEHEFQKKNPICTWPAVVRNPVQFFSKEPDRIYSLPLWIRATRTEEITILKTNAPKFKKHRLKNGNIDLDSLLSDASLKTVLIRDFDYGRLGEKILSRTAEGEQRVKKEYSKSVILLLPREKHQLLEMLGAGNYDYAFQGSLESEGTFKAFDKTPFERIQLRTKTAHTLRDPEMEFLTISCSKSAITLEAMPFINRFISAVRGPSWVTDTHRYRQMIDPGYSGAENATNFFFRTATHSKEIDYWYSLQEKWTPGLKRDEKFFEEKEAKDRLSPQPAPHRIHWIAERDPRGPLLVLSETALGLEEVYHIELEESSFAEPGPRDAYKKLLSPSQQRTSFQDVRSFHNQQVFSSFSEAFKRRQQKSGLKELTVFAHGLAIEDLQTLADAPNPFSALRQFSLSGASAEVTEWFLKRLPPNLEGLSLVGCHLSSIDPALLGSLVGEMKRLNLSYSRLTERQFLQMIPKLSSGLESLSLGYLRSLFSPEVADSVSRQKWSRLTELDLENDILLDSELPALLSLIRPKIKVLKLGHNNLSGLAIRAILNKPLPELQLLDLSDSAVGSKLSGTLTFPDSIQHLFLRNSQLSAENLNRIVFPNHLLSLDVALNRIGDEKAASLLKNLGPELRVLNLKGTGISDLSMKALSESSGTFDYLGLSGNGLRDHHIKRLSEKDLRVRSLDLSFNQIQNQTGSLIGKKWAPFLTQLDLSNTFISAFGIEELLSNPFPHLRALRLANVSGLPESLGAQLPVGLRVLDLSKNYLGNADLKRLETKLPQGLLSLNLSRSFFTNAGALSLARSLPPSLHDLHLEGTPIPDLGAQALSSALPDTLKSISLDPTALSLRTQSEIVSHLPRQLRTLQLEGKTQLASECFEKLPPQLEELRLDFSQFPKRYSAKDTVTWPASLRKLTLRGGPLAPEAYFQLLGHLPQGIEHLTLVGVGLKNDAFEVLNTVPLPNLGYVELNENQMNGTAIDSFIRAHPSIWYLELISNPKIGNELFASLSSADLARLKAFDLSRTRLSGKGLLSLLPKLKRDLMEIGMMAIPLRDSELSQILPLLPKTLFYLLAVGMTHGDSAQNKIRAWIESQALRNGVEAILWE